MKWEHLGTKGIGADVSHLGTATEACRCEAEFIHRSKRTRDKLRVTETLAVSWVTGQLLIGKQKCSESLSASQLSDMR